METRKMKIKKLNPAAYNPRIELLPGDPDYEKLKQSISRFGHVQPVVWNERTGNVVGGHQSLKVLKDLGYEDVDCVVVSLSESEEKTLNVALNKISGRWDIDKLSDLMSELVDEGMAMLTGYSEDEIKRLTAQVEQTVSAVGELNLEDFAEEAFQNKCPRCGFLY